MYRVILAFIKTWSMHCHYTWISHMLLHFSLHLNRSVIVETCKMIIFMYEKESYLTMSSWKEKGKQANEKAQEAFELISGIPGQSSAEQRKAMEEAFKKYQEAWLQSVEAFNEGVKEYSETQFEAYTKFFEEMRKNMIEAFRKYGKVEKK